METQETQKVANAHTTINAPVSRVWRALVTPAEIKHYMFGATVECDWKEGSPIVWKGEWKGKPYEDKGVILNIDPGHTLSYSHWSPLSGQPDTPENRHTVTIELAGESGRTLVSLAQDNNKTAEEQASSAKNWSTMLEGLKKTVEKS